MQLESAKNLCYTESKSIAALENIVPKGVIYEREPFFSKAAGAGFIRGAYGFGHAVSNRFHIRSGLSGGQCQNARVPVFHGNPHHAGRIPGKYRAMLDSGRAESLKGNRGSEDGEGIAAGGEFFVFPPPGYLAFWDKLEKADCFLEKAIQLGKLPYDNREVCSWFSYAITEGGFWNYFTDLVRKYGLVPYEKMPETACHSMLLTGVLEENGRPVHWKIENSYGIFGLHRGYYICSDSWFEKYMLSAVILKKYLKKYGKAWERAPHLFDIWEIM